MGTDGRANRSEETRAKLLAAARTEFAARGLAGSRVDRIAAAAGVNKERIYGLFGSKEGLFEALLAQTLGEATAAVEARPDDDFQSYVARKFDFHREHPDVARLNMWEALECADAANPADRRLAYTHKAEALAGRLQVSVDEARCAMVYALALATVTTTMKPVVDLVLDEVSVDSLKAFLLEAVTYRYPPSQR